MKKTVAILLLLTLCFSLTACSYTVNQTNSTAKSASADAVNVVSGYAELTSANPDIKLNDAPTGASAVTYSWMTNIPVIDQIQFTYSGCQFVYRAAACPNGVTSIDISGITKDFPAVKTIDVNLENLSGGSYVVRYDSTTGEGVANWTSTTSASQYSLYTPNGCTGTLINSVLTQVMAQMFICTQGAKSVDATVAGVNGSTITVTLSDNTGATMLCSSIKNLSVAAGDRVTLLYLGDLKGTATVLKITKTGSEQQQTLQGTVRQVGTDAFYIQTADNNIVGFKFNATTIISGLSSSISQNQTVTVNFTGDVNSMPLAASVIVSSNGTTPTSEPSGSYTDRVAVGTVTSVSGIYVSVDGALYEVNSAVCYVSGTPKVGSTATIYYRDYGNGKVVVTSAYFVDATPAPTYKDLTCCGYIVAVNGYNVTIDGGYCFTVNPANCSVSGTAQVGGYARIDYRDYGYGYYDVKSAVFSAPDPKPTPQPEMLTAYGTVDSYDGSTVSVGGESYIVGSGCYISGTAEQRGTATVWYTDYHDGRKVATQIEFYPAGGGGGSDYDMLTAYGTVDSFDGYTVSIGGELYTVGSDCYISGTAEQRGTATIWYNAYRDGRKVATQIEFYAPSGGGGGGGSSGDSGSAAYDMLTAYGTVDSYDGSTVSVGGVTYIIDSSCLISGTPEQRGTATVWYNSYYSDGRKVATQIEFYPAQSSADGGHATGFGF